MTLEQLVDYVRSIEPDCDCNRFHCDCKAKQEVSAEVEGRAGETEYRVPRLWCCGDSFGSGA